MSIRYLSDLVANKEKLSKVVITMMHSTESEVPVENSPVFDSKVRTIQMINELSAAGEAGDADRLRSDLEKALRRTDSLSILKSVQQVEALAMSLLLRV